MTPPAQVVPDGSRVGRRITWLYSASASLALLSLFAAYHPEVGAAAADRTVVGERWPWQSPSPFLWSRETATQVVLWAAVLVPLVLAFRPASRARGFVAGVGLGLGVGAYSALAWGQGPSPDWLFGVDAYVAPLLAMCVAAGLASTREGGRGLALARGAGVTLLAILLIPTVPSLEPGSRGVETSYDSPASVAIRAIVQPTTQLSPINPVVVMVVLSLIVGVLGVLTSVLAPRRWMVLIAVGGFFGVALYGVGWTAVSVFGHAERYWPDRSRLEALWPHVGAAVRTAYVPAQIGLYAAAREMLRRE